MTTEIRGGGMVGTIEANGDIHIGGLVGHLTGDLTDGTFVLGGVNGRIVDGVVSYGGRVGTIIDGVISFGGLVGTIGDGPTPPPPSGSWVTVFDQVNDGDSAAAFPDYTIRNLIPAAFLVPATKIRFSLQGFDAGAPYTGCDVTGAYVQAAGAGDPYDFSTTPVPLLVAGSPTFSIANGGTVVTDPAVLTVTGLANLVMSAQFATASSFKAYTMAAGQLYYKEGADAATVDASGYTSYLTNRIFLVSKIELFVPG